MTTATQAAPLSFPKLGECQSQAEQVAREHIWYVANIGNPVRFIKSAYGMWFWSVGEGQHNGASMTRKACKAHYEAFKAKAEALS
jgi:hypothetical protein